MQACVTGSTYSVLQLLSSTTASPSLLIVAVGMVCVCVCVCVCEYANVHVHTCACTHVHLTYYHCYWYNNTIPYLSQWHAHNYVQLSGYHKALVLQRRWLVELSQLSSRLHYL